MPASVGFTSTMLQDEQFSHSGEGFAGCELLRRLCRVARAEPGLQVKSALPPEQVTVGFAPSVSARGAAACAELVRQLAAALDKVQHLDVKGLRFMLGREYGVDSEGQLWLDVADNALFWSG